MFFLFLIAIVFSADKAKEVKDTNVILEEQLKTGGSELDFSLYYNVKS